VVNERIQLQFKTLVCSGSIAFAGSPTRDMGFQSRLFSGPIKKLTQFHSDLMLTGVVAPKLNVG